MGITCSSIWYPGTTEYATYTSGEVDGIFQTTYTKDSTHSTNIEPTSYVQCDPLPNYLDHATCSLISPLAWAALCVTFISVQLTWWVFDVPLLWNDNAGWRIFLNAISWACVRSHSPGTAATIALIKSSDISESAKIYYLGLKGQPTPEDWTKWKLCTAIGGDLITITASIMTIYQACTLPQYDPRRHFGLSLWVYPSLPVAVIGLCLLCGARFFPHYGQGRWWLFAFTLGILALVAVAVSLALWKFGARDEIGTWWISLFFYILMVLPIYFLGKVFPPCLMYWPGWCIGAWFVRVGGVSLAALKHYSDGQPYCKMPGPIFAVVYMVLGGIAAVLAFSGMCYHGQPILSWLSKLQLRGIQSGS
jgi:hypothetical protein